MKVKTNEEINEKIIDILNKKNENIDVLVKNITEEIEIFEYNKDDIFVSASIIKIPIMLSILNEVAKDNIKLNTIIKIKEEDILSDNECLKYGVLEYKIDDLITWSITKSCNSSTNILIKYLGFEKINKYCKEIGLNNTKLERYMDDEEAIKNGKNNYTGGLDYLNSDVGIFELNGQIYFIGISVYNTPKIEGDRKIVGKLSKMVYKYLKKE